MEYSPPEEFFRRMRLMPDALRPFGFVKNAKAWAYSERIADGALVCTISIVGSGKVSEKVEDPATGDEYVQHRVSVASGKFVGRVRQDVMSLMEKIAESCFERDI